MKQLTVKEQINIMGGAYWEVYAYDMHMNVVHWNKSWSKSFIKSMEKKYQKEGYYAVMNYHK